LELIREKTVSKASLGNFMNIEPPAGPSVLRGFYAGSDGGPATAAQVADYAEHHGWVPLDEDPPGYRFTKKWLWGLTKLAYVDVYESGADSGPEVRITLYWLDCDKSPGIAGCPPADPVASVGVRHEQVLGGEFGEDLGAVVGHHHLFLDAGG
jgi:hypothetical protein